MYAAGGLRLVLVLGLVLLARTTAIRRLPSRRLLKGGKRCAVRTLCAVFIPCRTRDPYFVVLGASMVAQQVLWGFV